MLNQVGIKILLVSDHYPPFIGGAHRQTQLLGRELRKRGHTVHVATVWHPGLPELEDDAGIHVHRLKQLRTSLTFLVKQGQQHQPPFPDPVTVIALRRLIDHFKPDVIHSYGWFTYSCAVALWGKEIPLLVSGRDYAYGCTTRTLVERGQKLCTGPELYKCLLCAGEYYGRPKGWAGVLGVFVGRKLLKRKVTGVHSISTYIQRILHRDLLGVHSGFENGSRLAADVIIPSFKEDQGEQKPISKAEMEGFLGQLPDKPFILFVGALRLVKGLAQLLKAYESLRSAPPLVLIGTVENDTPRHFPPGTYVLENFPHAAVMAAWERSLFGVVPSLWPEPLGSVVYEGMSKGKAVIGTKPGGHTDMIIDRETGLLVPLGDVPALQRAMQTLIDQPELRERYGQAALERAQMFTAGKAVPRFEQVYLDLAQLKGGT